MTAIPTLAQVMELAVRGILDDVRVALPGIVVSYNKTNQRAVVQACVRDGFEGENNIISAAPQLPPLGDVPVVFVGAGDYWQSYPIKKGDIIQLLFNSSSIATWKRGGGVVDPGDYRHHHIADAVAMPGPRDVAHAILGIPDDAWCINVPTGKHLLLGGPLATHAVPKGDLLAGALDDMWTAIAAAFTTSGAPSGAAATTAITAAQGLFTTAMNAVLSLKVKVE